MKNTRSLSTIIEKEGNGYVSLCPELDIASQSESVGDVRRNVAEARRLFFETVDEAEVERRLHSKVFITTVEVPVG